MAPADLDVALRTETDTVTRRIRALLKAEKGIPRHLRRAMAHSLLGGGKRLRPVLMLWTWDAVAGRRHKTPLSRADVLDCACALEMLHTYSLVHDDLPAMDDDDLRRGQPACHVAFDEATAILVGDGLQALCFSLLARYGRSRVAELVAIVADAAGPAGMVAGQMEDLEAEGHPEDPRRIRRIQRDKTARLIAAAIEAGAVAAGASLERRANLAAAGINLGLAFQGADDILDVTASRETLGKSVGKDADAGKATWIAVEGLNAAQRRTRRYGRQGTRGLTENLPAGNGRDRVVALADRLWNRQR